MWPTFGNSNISVRDYHNLNFVKIWPKNHFFSEGCSWFMFTNLGLVLGVASEAKGLKLKVRKFWVMRRFVEVPGETFLQPPSSPPAPSSWIGLMLYMLYETTLEKANIFFGWNLKKRINEVLKNVLQPAQHLK